MNVVSNNPSLKSITGISTSNSSGNNTSLVSSSSSSLSNNKSSGIGNGNSLPISSSTNPSLLSGKGSSQSITVSKNPSSGNSSSSTESKNRSLKSSTGISTSSTASTNQPLSSTKLQRSNNSFINFNKLKPLSNLQNNIYKDIFFKTKSNISINIKDIIGTFKKPKNEKGKLNYSDNEGSILNYNETGKFKFFKKIANLFREFINEKYSIIRELKKQKFANITMYYIDQFEDSLNRYLVYIYYKNTDLYFIYNNDENTTKLYDIGNLELKNINNIINTKSKLINLNKIPPQ